MLRPARILAVLVAVVPVYAQTEPTARAQEQEPASPASEEESQQTGQRHRAEGSDNEDADIVRSEDDGLPEEDVPEETVEFYVSARVVAGSQGDGLSARDNASRVGLFAAKDFARVYTLFARVEIGVNIVDAFDRILNPKANAPDGAGDVFARLSYLGVETPFGAFTVGKQWSAYWPVAAFTDRFAFSGGLSNAVFNAGTDGGGTGTGRAQSAFKYTVEGKGTSFRFQWQPGGQRIPVVEEDEYGYGLGSSVVYEWDSRLSLGAAFNYASIGALSTELELAGLAGDAQAVLLGAMYRDEPFYVAVNFVDHENHDTDDQELYIDGRGFEIYARYALRPKWRIVGGFNYLDATRQRPGGRYNLRVGLLSVQYSLRDESFRDTIYAEYILDDSLRSDGTGYPNGFVVGVRFGFEI